MAKKFGLIVAMVILFSAVSIDATTGATLTTPEDVNSAIEISERSSGGELHSYLCFIKECYIEVEDWQCFGIHSIKTGWGFDVVCYFNGSGTITVRGLNGEQTLDGSIKGRVIGFVGRIGWLTSTVLVVHGFAVETDWELR